MRVGGGEERCRLPKTEIVLEVSYTAVRGSEMHPGLRASRASERFLSQAHPLSKEACSTEAWSSRNVCGGDGSVEHSPVEHSPSLTGMADSVGDIFACMYSCSGRAFHVVFGFSSWFPKGRQRNFRILGLWFRGGTLVLN